MLSVMRNVLAKSYRPIRTGGYVVVEMEVFVGGGFVTLCSSPQSGQWAGAGHNVLQLLALARGQMSLEHNLQNLITLVLPSSCILDM